MGIVTSDAVFGTPRLVGQGLLAEATISIVASNVVPSGRQSSASMLFAG